MDELERDLGSDDYGSIAYTRGVGAFLNHARNNLDATVINAYHKGSHFKNNRKFEWGTKFQHEIVNDIISEWNHMDSSRFNIPHPQDSIGYTDPANIPYQYLTLNNVIKKSNFIESNRITAFFQNQHRFSKTKNITLKDSIYKDDKLVAIDTNFAGFRFFSITAGARGNYWDYNNQFIFSPRISFKLKPAWYEIKQGQIYRKNIEYKGGSGSPPGGRIPLPSYKERGPLR